MLTLITRLLIAILKTNKNQNNNKTKKGNMGSYKYICNKVFLVAIKIIKQNNVNNINNKDIK